MTYFDDQYEYKYNVFCIYCMHYFKSYVGYDDHMRLNIIGRRASFFYNCPFCDKLKKTANYEYICKELKPNEISLERKLINAFEFRK